MVKQTILTGHYASFIHYNFLTSPMTGTVQSHLSMSRLLPEYQLYSKHTGNPDIICSVDKQLGRVTFRAKESKI